jgi:hypothetical protein
MSEYQASSEPMCQEKLIEFAGMVSRASKPESVARDRARATILVLGLNREELVIARSERITAAWTAYRLSRYDGQDGEDGPEALELMTAPRGSARQLRAIVPAALRGRS